MNSELCSKCCYSIFYQKFWIRECISDTCPDNIKAKNNPKERFWCNCQRMNTNVPQIILEYEFKHHCWKKTLDWRDKHLFFIDLVEKRKLTGKLEEWQNVPEGCPFEQEHKLYEWNKNESESLRKMQGLQNHVCHYRDEHLHTIEKLR